MRHDVTFPLYVEVDEIYNLACPASPIHYQFDPVQTTKTSVIGAINMLGLAKRVGAKILQASTSEVYGDPSVHPQTEDYRGNVNPLGPGRLLRRGQALRRDFVLRLSPSAQHAHQGRTHLQYLRSADASERWPRGFQLHCPGACVARTITLYGNGSQTRAFCYVDDLVDGLSRLMATEDDVTGPMNLGNPHEIPVSELAARIIQLTGSASRIVHRPLPQDDPVQRCPDITMAKQHLSWEPRISLDDGLGQTIAYFAQLMTEQ